MDHTTCNFSQTCESQCMCVSRREEEVKLGFIAHMWRWKEMKEGRQGRRGAVFVLAVGDLRTDRAAVYISLLGSPPEA